MRVPSGWPLLVLAGAAAAVSVWAGSNLPVALPAAAVAVVVAALFAVGARRNLVVPPSSLPEIGPLPALPSLTVAMRAGRAGRTEVVGALDGIERLGLHPELSRQSVAEERRIRGLSPSEFRAYLERRLDGLEREESGR